MGLIHGLGSPAVPRTQRALRLLRPPKQAGPADYMLCRLLLPLGRGGRDGGEGRCHLKAWARPVGVLDEGSGILQDTACGLPPGPPSSPSGLTSG